MNIDVARVTAVLAVLVAVAYKLLPTECTGAAVFRLSVHLFTMGVPPKHPAFVTAELLLLSTRGLFYGFATLQADGGPVFLFDINAGEVVSSAIGLYGIDGQIHHL